MDTISIIVPIYNVEKYLRKCVDSILAQTYQNLEIILVDDGSPDGCGAICDEYAEKDARIKVIHKENGGLSDARNAGIDASTGEYLMFVDSDDYIALNMVEILLERVIKDGADMAVCNLCYVDGDGNELEERNSNLAIVNEIVPGKELLCRLIEDKGWYYITAVNRLYRRVLFDSVRFPIGKLHEDEFTAHYILDKAKKVSCVSQLLYYYVQREGSIINSAYTIKKLDAVEAFFDRVKYFYQKGLILEANKIFVDSMFIFAKAYGKREKTKEAKMRLAELKKEYNGLFFSYIKTETSKKRKLQALLFRFSPRLFHMLLVYATNNRKGE